MNPNAQTYMIIALILSLLLCGLAWADESDLIWSTFLGGSGTDNGLDIALDDLGNVCITGWTQSFDFPTTAGSFDPTYNSGDDVFVTKLNSEGNALIYSTLMGGSDLDGGYGIAVDDFGNAYVTGVTKSADFPTTALAFDTTHNGAGWLDVFAVKLNPAGNVLEYATFLGGEVMDRGFAIVLDDDGNAYVTGESKSTDFPTTVSAYDPTQNGDGDVFITKLNSTGSTLEYSTFLGGNGTEAGKSIEVDESGYACLSGFTASVGFPFTCGAFDTTYNGGSADAFVAKLDPTGSVLDYCTFLGGSGFERGVDMALNDEGNVYATGLYLFIQLSHHHWSFRPHTQWRRGYLCGQVKPYGKRS
jgi:hypothetical protein